MALWGALACLALRGALSLALELAHHGDLAQAGERLRAARVTEFLLALVLGLVLAGLGRWRVPAALRAVPAATLVAAYVSGWLGGDPSRAVALDTGLGRLAWSLLALAALGLAGLLFLPGACARLRARLAPGPALGLLVLLLAAPQFVPARAARPIRLHTTLRELAHEPGEILRQHASGAPGPGLIAPSRAVDPAGSGRPGLVLPPPGALRFELGDTHDLWLAGGLGVDHSMEEAAAARYPGHRVRFELRLDARAPLEFELPLAGAAHWLELGAGAGLELAGATTLELATRLLDAAGREVVPPDALRVGFGALRLERHAERTRARSSPTTPNLVFVLLDTLRADRTSLHGYGRATTPELEALAARGTRFDAARSSASWTWPSVATLFTGFLPEEHGVVDAVRSFLPLALETLAEGLQRAGFTTAAFSGSPLIVPEKQFDQGFELFDASREGFLRRAELVVPPALDWLAARRGERFFLYLHLMEPHAPYIPLEEARARFAPAVPRTFDAYEMLAWQWDLRSDGFERDGRPRTDAIVSAEQRQWASDLYDASVWSADHWLGVVLAQLAALGLDDETIVVVTSDHGEELFEHGLFAHGHSLHRELVHVPLVLAGPGLERGRVVSGPRSCQALGATLLRRLGLELPEAWPTRDLLDEPDGPLFFSTEQGWWKGRGGNPLYGIALGGRVLHWAPEGRAWGGGPPGEVALYDLTQDPDEREDLAAERPAEVALLQALLEQQRAGQVRAGAALDAPDAATLDMLRDIGYIGR